MAEKLGIYIHIPFCKAKCDYCDFYSLPERAGTMDDYLKVLKKAESLATLSPSARMKLQKEGAQALKRREAALKKAEKLSKKAEELRLQWKMF